MLGFTPYEGSLNLAVTADVLPALFRCRYDFAVHYAGTHRPMWHAKTADGEPCMVQWHSGMPANVLEVFSPHHLRSRFGLTNGTPVHQVGRRGGTVDAPDSNSGPARGAGSSPAGGTDVRKTVTESHRRL
jgi:hypothetical protein